MTTDKNAIDNIVKNAMTDANKDAAEESSQVKAKVKLNKDASQSVETTKQNVSEQRENNSESSGASEKINTEKKSQAQEKTTEASDKSSSPKKAATPPSTKEKTTKPKKSARWPIILLLLIMLCALAAMGYFLWVQDKKINAISSDGNSQTQQYETKVNTLETHISSINNDINSQLDQQKQSVSQLQKENEMLKQQISGQREQWAALTTTTNEDWKLAEAHYLTRLAGQRLVMERNSQGALALLQAADEILQKLTDPELFRVREKLVEDITALKLVKSVDREGIFLSLAAMSKALVVLPSPVPQNYQNAPLIAEEKPKETAKGFDVVKQSFSKALSALQSYIRITKHDETIQSLLPAEGQAYLQNSLRLTIETAQLALLKEQQLVFEESLGKASRLLSEYYPFSKEAESLVGDLNALKQHNIIQVLPEITQSQKALAAYIERLHRLKNMSEPQAAVKSNSSLSKPAAVSAQTTSASTTSELTPPVSRPKDAEVVE
ncbi:MAG: uroporphyrinogen-III C-methyltransferase [Cellvibrionaceae bacterium]